ncbi:uncharacterized protein LOC115222756 isoform X2 [Octopus sinensis]|uniref:Uncharacterized protein LOC115222756 isoform X2 n=1 Tax=Octopus sinensis TaxID=2607531 RepID=A0A7E6FKC8_9MOLL|nr:uncharacterized protein LOC115222756 isoform X2 [Octopus sinensis]
MTESYCKNIFGEISQKNVLFCIETSGNMLPLLPIVKNHLQLTLEKMAANERKIYFNIIEFSSRVLAWADKLICSTHETVRMAIDWLNELSARTGCNTLEALRSAFRQDCIDAVYFVTCSQPDQHPDAILDEIIPLSKGCPIHCIYFTGDLPDDVVENFLEDLSLETHGTYCIFQAPHEDYSFSYPKLLYSSNNERQNVIRSTSGDRYSPEKTCSVTSTLQVDPNPSLVPNSYPVMYPFGIGMATTTKPQYYPTADVFPYYLSKACLGSKQFDISPYLSPGAGAILIGKKVLAQNYEDGYFYIGEVHSQIRTSEFLVAFGPCHHKKYKETTYQETNISDIIDYNESLRHSIEVGDCVLAPGPPPQNTSRFSCGRVLEGQEARQTELKYKDVNLVVSFENGTTSRIPRNAAIWIPQNAFDHIKLKVHQPRSLKQEPYYKSQTEMPEFFPLEPRIWAPSLRLRDYHPMALPSYVPMAPLVYNMAAVNPYGIPYLTRPTWYPKYQTLTPKYSVSANDLPPEKVAPVSKLCIKELDDKVQSVEDEPKDILETEKEMSNIGDEQQKELLADVYQPILCETEKTKDESTEEFKVGSSHLPYTSENLPDLGFYDDNGLEELYQTDTKDEGVNAECLKFPSKPTNPGRPMWKYWAKNPTRSLNVSRRNKSPFQETTQVVPFELRDKNRSLYEDYSSNSAFHYVDRFSKHTQNDCVATLLKTPKPPSVAPPAQQERNQIRKPNNCRNCQENSSQKERAKPSKMLAVRYGTTEEQKKRFKSGRRHNRERVLQDIIHETNADLNGQEQIDVTHAAKRALNAEISQAVTEYHQQQQHQQQQRMLLKCKGNVRVKPASVRISNNNNNNNNNKSNNYRQEVKGVDCVDKRRQGYGGISVAPLNEDQKKQYPYEKSQQYWANVRSNLLQRESLEKQKYKETQETRLLRKNKPLKQFKEGDQNKKYWGQELVLYRTKIMS